MVVISSFKEPETPIRLRMNDVEVVLNNKPYGVGTLYVSEGALGWEKNEKDLGFLLSYFNISIHAISRDKNVYEKDCIYILTDPHVEMPGDERTETSNPEKNEDDDDDEDDEADVSQLLLIPQNSSNLEIIYEAITTCQTLNPDPADMEDDEDEELFADAEEDPDSTVGAGGDTIEDLAQRLENSNVNINYSCRNGNDDEEFEDAD